MVEMSHSGPDWEHPPPRPTPPTPDEVHQPYVVPVEFELFVKGIQSIDALRGLASVCLQVNLFWTDSRIAEAFRNHEAWEPPRKIWAPGVVLANGMDEEEQLTEKENPGHRVVVLDKETGKVRILLHFFGQVDNIMDLNDFPFDHNSLDLRFVGARMLNGRSCNTNAYELCPRSYELCNPDKPTQHFVHFFFADNLPEFELLGVSHHAYQKYFVGCKYSVVAIGIMLKRKHLYYFFKVIILMWLIALLSMPVFLYEFDEFKLRMDLISTMFLATAATLYVVSSDLPKTEKLNKMDKLVLGTLAVIFAAGCESVAVWDRHSILDEGEKEALENATMVALPALYALLNITLFVLPVMRQVCKLEKRSWLKEMREGHTFTKWSDDQIVEPWNAQGLRERNLSKAGLTVAGLHRSSIRDASRIALDSVALGGKPVEVASPMTSRAVNA